MSGELALPEADWSSASASKLRLTTGLFWLGTVAIAGAFLYHHEVVGPAEPLFGYPVGRLDWLWLVSLWAFVVYAVVPSVGNPRRAWSFLRQFRTRPVGLVAGLFTAVVFLAGTLGPLVLSQPTPNFMEANQPPVFASASSDVVYQCLNPAGDTCYGTWKHPLGTTDAGKDILRLLVMGSRTVVKLSMVSVMLIVPVSTLVGTVSAYFGGAVDRALTSLSETLKVIPALLVYLTWRWINATTGSGGSGPFMLVVCFAVFSWGTAAGIVRSRALDEVSKNYVSAAKANGADTGQVIRWHLVPNISPTAFTLAVNQVPLFITIEATLAFLQFGTPPSPLLATPTGHEAWGEMIADNIGVLQPYWWRSLMPIAALLLTIVSVTAFANALEDIVDPRGRS